MKIKLASVHVDDQAKALRFYTEVRGFVKRADFSRGPYRWLTMTSPEDPDGTELSVPRSKGIVISFWTVTALFCLQIAFTAYAQLTLRQVAEAFTHLGFPDYFRVELAWAKLLGVVLLLAPVPARLKEWTYAGFAITLVSALIAHLAVGDGPEAWGFAAGTGVLWGLSYVSWRRLEAVPESA
jgi:hypothetical protein